MKKKNLFNLEAILEKAVSIFQKQGHHPTNAEQLVEHLGISQKELYSEFGSSKELFEKALDHYCTTTMDHMLGRLETRDSGIEQIRELFNILPERAKNGVELGCTMCNTSGKFSGVDLDIERVVNRYFSRIPDAFQNALDNSHLGKEIHPNTNTKHSASFFATTLLGITVLIRGKAPVSQVRLTCDGALGYLKLISV